MMALFRQGFLYGYMGDEVASWILFIVFLIIIIIVAGFLIRFMNYFFWPVGAVIAILILWFFIGMIEPYEIFPNLLLDNDLFIDSFYFLTTYWGLVVLTVVAIILSLLIDKLEEEEVFALPRRRRGLFGRRRRR